MTAVAGQALIWNICLIRLSKCDFTFSTLLYNADDHVIQVRTGMQAHGGSGHAERRTLSRSDILPILEGNEVGSQIGQLDGADSNECGWYVLLHQQSESCSRWNMLPCP